MPTPSPQAPAEEQKQTTRAEDLRWIADLVDRAQWNRIRTGEQLRAILQGRDPLHEPALADSRDPDQVLRAVRSGHADGPLPLLGRAYRRHWEEEKEATLALTDCVTRHPAWPWLEQVRGVGATLAGKLLALLDIHRAATPSAFWAYCGLATVPGTEYRCGRCGSVAAVPTHYSSPGRHRLPGSTRGCPGQFEPTGRPNVRISQRSRRETDAHVRFNPRARKMCYLLGVSFLRAGGPYADHYRRERERLDRLRAGWPEKRKHLAALRTAEKLFLLHLWQVWRAAEGLDATPPVGLAESAG